MSTVHEGKRLPPGWVKCESSKYPGASYFFDTQTGKSLWFPPEAAGATAAVPTTPPLPEAGDEATPSPRAAKRPRPSDDVGGAGVKVGCIAYLLLCDLL